MLLYVALLSLIACNSGEIDICVVFGISGNFISSISRIVKLPLISFFKKYGKGQLIFTTHNIEAMKSLKSQSKSILALGVNNKIDTWVGKGNKSPISDYINGEFPNSPMNIEDFDFINIFLGEE